MTHKTIKAADLFCGAGGTSTGLLKAAERLGFRVELTAVNHWPRATETFALNHPEGYHRVLCTGVDDINPRDLYAEGELDFLWASPECTHHSVARGGRPVNEQSRATAWCVVRWADAVRPGVILVENVPEFISWGGIGADGKPLQSKKGATFVAWVGALESLGYRVDWRVLCAADFGAPTTRRRLFVQAVRGKRRIVWPEPSHDPLGETDLLSTRQKWRAAREIIDWSLPAQSIYERKTPLKPKTMDRIMAGLTKFGLKPFVVPQQSNPTPKGVDEPLPTICAEGSRHKLAQAFIMSAGGPECAPRSVDEPMGAVLTRDHRALVEPFIVRTAHGNDDATGNERRTHDIRKPLGTVACSNDFALAQPFIIPQHSSHPARSVEAPAPTVTTTILGIGLAQPYLVKMRGTSQEQVERHSAGDIESPTPTITSGGGHLGLAEPSLVQLNHDGPERTRSVDTPLPTVCGNRGEFGVCEPSLLPQQSDGALRPISAPCPTVATSGAIGLVEPFLIEYYGNGQASSVNDPLATVTTKDRHALIRPQVIIEGQRYLLDIRFRMLQPHELAGAQGFPSGYQFSGTKTEQVKQIGNAVPPDFSEALVAAQLTQCPRWWEVET
jgi:DNA (cytosine-5)-methyltransferase 1